MSVRVTWKGDALKRQLHDAEVGALTDTAAAAAERARSSHPGWRNETGATEASIEASAARRESSGAVATFGSKLRHFLYLEIGYRGRPGDHTLRRAADVEGGHIGQRIAARTRR